MSPLPPGLPFRGYSPTDALDVAVYAAMLQLGGPVDVLKEGPGMYAVYGMTHRAREVNGKAFVRAGAAWVPFVAHVLACRSRVVTAAAPAALDDDDDAATSNDATATGDVYF